jgi:UDP-galactopyranose mutase
MEAYPLHDNGSGLRASSHRRPLPDLICLSHLRWNSVHQRTQHLMTRWARERRVFFVEAPLLDEETSDDGTLALHNQGVFVATTRIGPEISPRGCIAAQARLLDRLLAQYRIEDYVLWYDTPMALPFTHHLQPRRAIYDCLENSAIVSDSPPERRRYEAALLAHVDMVLTGGQSLYEAKRMLHPSVHLFPSGIDRDHFAQAHHKLPEPTDQLLIPHPRIGFFGVIDDRMDLALIGGLAKERPSWHIVLLGPIVKLDPQLLPRRPNIHYLGMKSYVELPAYLRGWDVATLPLARNEAARYISPTRVLEYLAAGKPVVSTSLQDIVYPYGQQGLVQIADTVPEFAAAVEDAMAQDSTLMQPCIEAALSRNTWEQTWQSMKQLIDGEPSTNACAQLARPTLSWP